MARPAPPLAALAIAGCPLFPSDNHFNQRVDRLPVHERSGAIMRSIGLDRTVHPDFGSGRYEGTGSGAIFDLRSNRLRPRGWTSADAAGLPILPGLARYREVRRGAIRHALRFTVPRTRRAFVYPARHFASSLTDPDLPAMGQRLRLRRGIRLARFPRQARVIVRALKRYGMLLADNGSSIYVSGAPHPGWDNDDLATLKQLRGSDFEVVDTSELPRPRGG